jgi:hypothetical protein
MYIVRFVIEMLRKQTHSDTKLAARAEFHSDSAKHIYIFIILPGFVHSDVLVDLARYSSSNRSKDAASGSMAKNKNLWNWNAKKTWFSFLCQQHADVQS